LGTNKNLLSSGADPRGTITINLAENSSHYLAYDNINAESLADSSDDAGSYVKGRPDAAYMVKITTSNTGAPTDLTQLQVIVSSPGAARESARQSYAFVSLLPTK
jgi:hypothetical protein